MIRLPRISNYGEYASDNYGVHSLVVEIGPMTVWFSYTTPIAFQVDGYPRVVLRNHWKTVTGKQLNWIDGKNHKNRVDQETFDRLWKEQVEAALQGHLPPAPPVEPEPRQEPSPRVRRHLRNFPEET